eukprot:3718470-Prorocentrum_lima.AAC.1
MAPLSVGGTPRSKGSTGSQEASGVLLTGTALSHACLPRQVIADHASPRPNSPANPFATPHTSD